MKDKRAIAEAIKFAFFPRRCVFCASVIAPDVAACTPCARSVTRVEDPVCRLCGRGKEYCLCDNQKPFYSGLFSPFYYEASVRRGIHNFKFRDARSNAAFFAEEMVVAIPEEQSNGFDLVLCVPLSKKSLRQRGYNQSALLAERVAEKLNTPFCGQALVKILETPAQHSMDSSKRRGNLVGAFDVADPSAVNGAKVLLCDDVATTGSTLNECAKMLMLAGAAGVWCVTAAVTRKHNDNTPGTGR